MKLAKTIGWLALIHGLLTLGTVVVVISTSQDPASTLIRWSALGVVGVAAGIGALKGRPSAFRVLFGLYLIQLADYWQPGFYLSLMGPLPVNFAWGWSSPPIHVDLNLLAIAACVVTWICARRLYKPSSEHVSPQGVPSQISTIR